MTVGTHVLLGEGAAGSKEVMGHELGHVDKNLRGMPETGSDNGSGVSVTDPDQRSERVAAADGAAFAAGAGTAPSLGSRPAQGLAPRPAPGNAIVARMLALQSAAGNRAVARMMGAAGAPPVQRMAGHKSDRGEARKPSTKQVRDALDAQVKESWPQQFGGGRHGRGPEQVRMRYARPMDGDRTAQTLSHQSFLLYDAISAVNEDKGVEKDEEREVQGMLINNRLLFASNYNASMRALGGYQTDGTVDTYPDLVSKHPSAKRRLAGLKGADAEEYDQRIQRAAVKTQAVLAGARGAYDATAAALQERHGSPVQLLDIGDKDLHDYLTNEVYEGAVFLVAFSEDEELLHAEQKLMLALHRSGIEAEDVRGEHAIMGRYRGCLCCTAALAYYKSKFPGLNYDPNPGFYYYESLENLYRHQKHVINDPEFQTTMLALASGLPSTPALTRMRAPMGPEGPLGETIESAGQASRRNYRTPSPSDMGMGVDEKGMTAFYPYTMEQDIEGVTGSRVGKGSKRSLARLNAPRIINNIEDRQYIQQTWQTGTEEQRRACFTYWEKEKKATRTELAEILDEVDPRGVQALVSAIYRCVEKRTGHESRDSGKGKGKAPVRQPQKGKYAEKKPQKETRKPLDKTSKNWSRLTQEIEADPDFHQAWLRREKKQDTSHIEPRNMPLGLRRLVQTLSAQYTTSSMARRLHIAERSLTREVKKPLPPVPDVGTSSGVAQAHEIPGLTRYVDEEGQTLYVDEQENVFVIDPETGRLVQIHASAGTHDAMDWIPE
ncbi:hypothetical protein ACFV6E_07330 [Streptomyces sp. NPDC059785]